MSKDYASIEYRRPEKPGAPGFGIAHIFTGLMVSIWGDCVSTEIINAHSRPEGSKSHTGLDLMIEHGADPDCCGMTVDWSIFSRQFSNAMDLAAKMGAQFSSSAEESDMVLATFRDGSTVWIHRDGYGLKNVEDDDVIVSFNPNDANDRKYGVV